MAEIVYKYEEMETAAATIEEIKGQYETAANTFVDGFIGAIAQWEGESKDKMSNFINVPVKEYMHDTVPKLLDSLASLLRENAKQMQQADQQIAENIPQSLN